MTDGIQVMKTEQKADWLAIFIHFLVGFLVGGATTFFGLLKGGVIYRSSSEKVIGFMICGSVAVGAGYALLQNSAWIGENYNVIPPIPARHDFISKLVLGVVSIGSVIGFVLCGYLL